MVRSTDQIGFGLGPAIPDGFMTALGRRDDWEDLVHFGALCLNLYDVFTKPGVSYRCGFFGPSERLLLSMGHRVDYVPGGFRQFAPILARYAPRVMVAQAAPPGPDGTVNLSLHLGATRPELLRAGADPDRLLIVEVNPNLPRTTSLMSQFNNTIPMDLIDIVVESRGTPFSLEDALADEVDLAIARHALKFVTEGSTLQTGIGAIPNLVVSELASGELGGFGIHSEMFTTGLMRLHQAGKVTNLEKGVFDGVSVTTFALGTAELYAWLDGNDQVAFVDVEVVNDPSIIAQNAKLVSINGGLSVDRTGCRGQRRWPTDLRRGRTRGLCRRGRDAPRCTLPDLPAVDRGEGGDGGVPYRGSAARRIGGGDSPPPYRGGCHRIRCSGTDRAHRAGAGSRIGHIAHPDFRQRLRAVADELGGH